MAQAKLRQVDLTTVPTETDPTPPLPVAGRITITFYDVDGQMVPDVSFAPLGRINPNTVERFLPFIYQAIQREQVVRRGKGEAI